MSVFPELIGEDIAIWKQPEFSTTIFQAMSGIESRVMRRQYPVWSFGIPVQFLMDKGLDSDLLTVMTFFIEQKGAGLSFLYADSQGLNADNAVVGQTIGTGNGVKTAYQLQRTYAGITEPVNNAADGADVFLDGVLQSDYTLSDTGLVTFDTAPDSGAVVTWTGSFYYRVRFLDDKYKFVRASGIHHSCDDLQFIGSVRNIV
jgi:uncharacterized protein (TIGR02217 family)